MKVTKRDGSVENYSVQTVKRAIREAFKTSKQSYTKDILQSIVDDLALEDKINVEVILNQIEKSLQKHGFYDVAKEFILYRDHKNEIRHWVQTKKEFIEKYKKSSNTANATIDDNSNVSSKNIGVMNAEIHKEDNIQVNRRLVMDKLKELFSDFNSKQYMKDLKSHIMYKNDENSFAGISPYTYSPKEVVNVKYGPHRWLCALDTLYSLIDCDEELVDEEKEVYIKYPTGLYVQDKNGWTEIKRLVRKKRHRDLVRIKTAFGEDLVVTDNHPLIVSDNINNTIQAIDSLNKSQYRCDLNIEFGGKCKIDMSNIIECEHIYKTYVLTQNCTGSPYVSCKRYIDVNEKFGYIVGFFVGDGHYDNNNQCLSFTQKDKNILEKLADYIYEATGCTSVISYKKDKSRCFNMKVCSKMLYTLFKQYFKIKDYAQNKNLPINLLEFNKDFVKGILEGLIDADGSISDENRLISIRLSSRECIHQITTLLRIFNYGAANTIQNRNFHELNNSYKTNYTIWGVCFSKLENCESFELSEKWKSAKYRTSHISKYSLGWSTITNVEKIENCAFLDQCDYIYDITTESSTFVSSNIWVHNCVSITMYPFLHDGLSKIGGLSARPKNLDSFCGMYVNLIFAISALFAGAVATPEVLVFFDYFAKKEFGDDYYLHYDEFYKIGPDLRTLLNKSGKWFNNVNSLKSYDFETDELNKLRDKVVYNSERELTKDELKSWEMNNANDEYAPIKLGDCTRTIGAAIHQYFQQIV